MSTSNIDRPDTGHQVPGLLHGFQDVLAMHHRTLEAYDAVIEELKKV